MNRPKSPGPLIAVALALPFAQAQAPNNLAHAGTQEFSVELDALVAQHQYARAEQLVDKRLARGDDPAAIYFQIGRIYFNHEAWQRSAGFLERSLQLRGMNDEAHQLLGLDWRELHRPENAEAELIEAAKENPSNGLNDYFAGHQLVLNGKFEAALPYLYRALTWKPVQSEALQALALAQARLGNYGLAESYYRKGVDSAQPSDDGHYSALINLSILLLLGHDSARLEEGLGYARRAQALQPDSPEAHFLMGKALFKLGRLSEASPELARAAKLNSEDSRPHFLLARIYDELGQHDQARKERDTFVRLQGRPGQVGMATDDLVPFIPK